MDLLPRALTPKGIDLALYRHFPFVLPREGAPLQDLASKLYQAIKK